MARINVYAGGILDRAAPLRSDESWVEAHLANPAARYLAVWRGRNLVCGDDPPQAVMLPREAVADAVDQGAPVVLLGVDGAVAHFAVDYSAADDDPAPGALADYGEFRDLREFGGLMAAPVASLLAQARGFMYWHQRYRFCSVCGSPAHIREAGHVRQCSDEACGVQHFPRTDPAVIMLVNHGDNCLLGRQASWPEGLYSTLAGFVEPGESLEEAVAREISEESGVTVRDVLYHSSQPWPFPASLMLGFYATAVNPEITIDHDELDDARWFSRDELLSPSGSQRLPRRDSISRQLVDDWLNGSGERHG